MTLTESNIVIGLSAQGALLALCLRIDFTDGRIIGMTTHDTDVVFDGVSFVANPGFRAGPLTVTSGLGPDHITIETGESDRGVNVLDLGGNTLKNARVELFRVNTEDLNQRITLMVGTIGEVDRVGPALLLELRSPKQNLAKRIGRVYRRGCDGDCDSADERQAIITAQDGLRFTIDLSGGFNAPAFIGGTFEAPEGSGAIRTIDEAPGGVVVTLWSPLGRAPELGTSVTLKAPCDTNICGFPTIPGVDVLSVQRRQP